jgi:hypothetical protein
MSYEEEIDKNKDMELLINHCSHLAEHFETVQIFVTRTHEDGGTINAQYGEGNWFSRFGQIKMWLKRESYRIKMELKKEYEEENYD